MTKVHSAFLGFGGLILIVGIALSAMGAGAGLEAPWLYGAVFWSCVTFGCLGLSLLFHLTRGRWGTPLLRIFEAGGSLIHVGLVAAVLFAGCFIVFKDAIYGAWTHMPAEDMILQRKKFYLNETGFIVRSAIYFAILGAIAYFFPKWTREEELSGDKKWSDKRNNWAGISMVAFFMVLTFLVTDYIMSIDPHWYSTIWGVWFAVGGALAAMSLAVAIVINQGDKEPFVGKLDNLMRNDFGNLLFMLTMLWGYFSFSQLLIIWSGNLKEFIPFYLARLRGDYSALGSMIFVGQFLLPFLLLLAPTLKKSKVMLSTVAGMIFLFRMVDVYWIIFPYFRESFRPSIMDFGPFLAIGGVWLVGFALMLKRAPMVTTAHPYESHHPLELKEAIENV